MKNRITSAMKKTWTVMMITMMTLTMKKSLWHLTRSQSTLISLTRTKGTFQKQKAFILSKISISQSKTNKSLRETALSLHKTYSTMIMGTPLSRKNIFIMRLEA